MTPTAQAPMTENPNWNRGNKWRQTIAKNLREHTLTPIDANLITSYIEGKMKPGKKKRIKEARAEIIATALVCWRKFHGPL